MSNIEKEAKEALIVTGFWDEQLKGKEVDALIHCFLGTVRLLNHKTNALTVAIDFIGSLKDGGMPQFRGVFAEDILTNINQALVCTNFEDYTPISATVN